MEIDAPGELGWTALKYVAHRLEDPDATAFEEKLAEDQSAREAVAQAVELSHCVAVLHGVTDMPPGAVNGAVTAPSAFATAPTASGAAPSLSPAANQPRAWWRQPASWISVGLAASLAFVLANAHWGGGRGADVAPDLHTMNELSVTWAGLQDAPAIGESARSSADGLVFNDGLPPADAEQGALADNTTGSGEIGVPEWLLLGLESNH